MTIRRKVFQKGGGIEDSFNSTIACLMFIIVCLGLVCVHLYMTYVVASKPVQKQQPQQQQQQQKQSPPVQGTILGLQSDPRFAPLSPERSYYVSPDMRGQPIPPGVGAMPINIQTQGLPDSFQQLGILTAPGGTETSASPTRTILPLFGRRTMYSRDKWNYYTRTDGINPVQVPVQFKRRNCDEDTGCDEVLDGDSVGCPVLGQSYVANVYRNSTPRYLPTMF